jgi:hypothetical protein
MLERLHDWKGGMEAWAAGRRLWPRVALLVYLAYAGVRHLADPLYRSWFAGITLVFHEMGHLVFSFAGETMKILGGSLMQLLVPIAAAVYLRLFQKDRFGFAVCLAWLAFSAWDLATYIGDASHEDLPLVSMGGTPEHDWSNLLTKWRLLNKDRVIATCVRVFATITWVFAMGLGTALSVFIWRHRARAVKDVAP